MQFKWSLLVVLACGIAALIWLNSRPKPTAISSSTQPESPSSSTANSVQINKASSVYSASTDDAQVSRNRNPKQTPTPNALPRSADPFDYGKTPKVKGDANEQVQSVVEAVRNGQHPEQLSVMIAPKAFDLEAYKAGRVKYLNTIEPGRVFQPAQPGEKVQRIKPVSPEFVKIPQDGSTVLRVQVLPNIPCTFTSFDNGKFSNELTSITVEANEKGIAETKFLGAPGTIEDVHILSASPLTSGQVRFTINVTQPIQTAAAQK